MSREAVRILRLFGDTETQRVIACVGPEQEYFLIDKEDFAKREDLRFTGRTLFGAPAAEGSGAGRSLFRRHPVPGLPHIMKDLDEDLWQLGDSGQNQAQ